jgi:hypothetical protein
MEQIRFKQGDKQHFVSTRPFALGNTGTSVPKGADIFFDGSTVEFGGQTYSFPQLRGAIKAGWVVPTASYDENDPEYGRPLPAGIQVRHATLGGNPMQPTQKTTITTTESDERVVGNTASHAAKTKQSNTNHQRGMPVNTAFQGTVEPQDGVPVRSLKTAAGEKAKQTRTVLTAESVGSALRQANSSGVIDPGEGISEDEMLSRMPEEDREMYLVSKEAHKSKYVDEEPRAVRQVKTAKTGVSEGMSFRTDVGGGIEIADAGGYGGVAKQSVIMEDGVTFRTTNGPEKKTQPHPRSEEAQRPSMVKDGTVDIRRSVAKSMCSDFPDTYDFTAPARKKIARLQADFEDRSDVIRAVFAAEADDFKAILVQEFPQAFGA